MSPPALYEKSKSLGSGGSMVARLKLKGIDGRAPPGVNNALCCFTQALLPRVVRPGAHVVRGKAAASTARLSDGEGHVRHYRIAGTS